MQTGSNHVLIEVSPSRLELAVVRGRKVLRSAARRIEVKGLDSNISGALNELRTCLAELVNESGCSGLKATVIYHSAAASVLVTSAPSALAAADAEEAARLAIASVADFALEGSPFCSMQLLVDNPAGSASASVRQNHVLSAAERGETVDAIVAWIEASGLRFEGAILSAAVAMHGAAHAAWSIARRAGDRAAVLWIGEHGSALACVTEGSVRFVRSVGVGIESLVDALCQPLRSRDEAAPELKLDREAARSLLAAVGVPSAETQLPGLPGFTGAALLPVLQPALQRITIEAKQSLRFGIPEQERAHIRLQVAGPGACVPGLRDWIARQCGLEQIDSRLPEAGAIAQSSQSGAIAEVVASGHSIPALVPERIARRTLLRHARVALALGVAVAATWIGGDWLVARKELAAQQHRLELLEAAARTGEAAARIRDATIAASQALAGVESRIAATLGSGADAPGVLEAVALSAPEAVRLTTIELASEKSGLNCHISGFVRLSESTEPTRAITEFVDVLSTNPLVRSVRLGATQRTRIGGAQSHGFELIVELVPLPLYAATPILPVPLASGEGNP